MFLLRVFATTWVLVAAAANAPGGQSKPGGLYGQVQFTERRAQSDWFVTRVVQTDIEIHDENGTVVTRIQTDSDGGYKVNLPPGRYTITALRIPDFWTKSVRVSQNWTRVNISVQVHILALSALPSKLVLGAGDRIAFESNNREFVSWKLYAKEKLLRQSSLRVFPPELSAKETGRGRLEILYRSRGKEFRHVIELTINP